MKNTIDTVMGQIDSQCNNVSILSIRYPHSTSVDVAYGALCGMWSIYLTLTDNNPDEELKFEYRRAVIRYKDRQNG